MQRDMHPEDIKSEIRKRGYTLTSLAEENGLHLTTMAAAIRSRTSERAEKIIAELLQRRPQEIWPSRYRPDGRRIFLIRPSRHTEKADAAA